MICICPGSVQENVSSGLSAGSTQEKVSSGLSTGSTQEKVSSGFDSCPGALGDCSVTAECVSGKYKYINLIDDILF